MVSGEDKLTTRNDSLNNKYNVLYIDVPYDSGFSRVGDESDWIRNRTDFVECMKDFWKKFVVERPEYKDRDIYFTGISYAGHWTPYIARAIYELGAKVRGVSIGNGWMDAATAYREFPDFAYLMRNYTNFDLEDYERYRGYSELCEHVLKRGVQPYVVNRTYFCEFRSYLYLVGWLVDKGDCFSTKDIYTCRNSTGPESEEIKKLHKKISKENFLREKTIFHNPYSEDKESLLSGSFFEHPAVQKELGINMTYNSMSNPALYAMREVGQHQSSLKDITYLVQRGIKMLIYHGDMDFICNVRQGEVAMAKMPWKGQKEWNQMDYEQCKFGWCKELFNLRFVKFKGAGHFTFIRNRTLSFELIEEFIDGVQKGD